MKVLVVTPTYNERENIHGITSAVRQNYPEAHMLIVDDNSPDGTGREADTIAAKDFGVKVLHRKSKDGLGPAYIAGFQYALQQGYDAVITFDADFSHPVSGIGVMMEKLRDHDLVVGSRYLNGNRPKNWPLKRYLLSRNANFYARWISGMKLVDCTGGFNGLRCSVFDEVNLSGIESTGYVFHHEIKYRAWKKGFKFFEFPIEFTDRTAGKSKMSKRIIIEAFFKVLKLRFSLSGASN